MKQNSSTTTSAHTGIDDSKSYVFMSSGLEEFILGGAPVNPNTNQLGALINLDGDYVLVPFISAFVDESERRVVVVSSTNVAERLLKSFALNETLDFVLSSQEFKAIVVRVDSDRSYLRILEQ